MKIGIMTFWWSDDNYGQLLQCYALQKYLRDAGHDAYLIRYDPRNDYLKTPLWRKAIKAFNPVELIKYLAYRKKMNAIKKEKKENPRNFDVFREKYIKQSKKVYYSYDELAANPPEADVYIVGSDQVWNTFSSSLKQIRNRIKAYFLDFGSPKIKRIAYAASFGTEKVSNDFINIISPLLKRFDYISVREKSGVDICQRCGVEAEWVPDPTLLFSGDDYRFLYAGEHRITMEKPYLFLYLLGTKSHFPVKSVYDWANNKNFKVVYITGNLRYDNYKKSYATIPSWLYLIDNAEYVVTNSFHCTIFALIFGKKFGIIKAAKEHSGMNTRFISLFEMFKIGNKFIANNMDIMDKETEINFGELDSKDKVDKILSSIIK
jgi:hypothetical protein